MYFWPLKLAEVDAFTDQKYFIRNNYINPRIACRTGSLFQERNNLTRSKCMIRFQNCPSQLELVEEETHWLRKSSCSNGFQRTHVSSSVRHLHSGSFRLTHEQSPTLCFKRLNMIRMRHGFILFVLSHPLEKKYHANWPDHATAWYVDTSPGTNLHILIN